MIAFELAERTPDRAKAIVDAAFERGLLLLSCGLYGNVIRLLPAADHRGRGAGRGPGPARGVARGSRWRSATADIDIRVVGVRKRYGDVAAVDGVDLDVARGEFFTMLGPSGSGKTTTLRMIAGFERPDEGTDRARRARRLRPPAVRPPREHRLPGLRAVPAHDGAAERRVRPAGAEGGKGGAPQPGERGALPRAARRLRRTQARPALRRAAPARRARAGDREHAAGAPARRAARRPRPEAAPGAADRAQAAPAGARDDVRLRHPRPGRGAHDERSDRRLQPAAASSRWARRREMYEHPATAFVAGFIGTSNILGGTGGRSPCARRRSGCSRSRRRQGEPGTVRADRLPRAVDEVRRRARRRWRADRGPAEPRDADREDIDRMEGRRVRLHWQPDVEFAIEEEGT